MFGWSRMQGRLACFAPSKVAQPNRGKRGRPGMVASGWWMGLAKGIGKVEDRMGHSI
jgi:hypothetical protein